MTIQRFECEPVDPKVERIRVYTALAEISRAVVHGHLTREGLADARQRLKTANEWPSLTDIDRDLDAMRIRLIDLVCRHLAAGDPRVLEYYGQAGDLIDHVPDDLSALEPPPEPPPPPSYGVA